MKHTHFKFLAGLNCRLLSASNAVVSPDDVAENTVGKIWEVVLVSPGRAANGFDFPPDVLREAAPMFNGVPALRRSDEKHTMNLDFDSNLIVGYYRGCRYEENRGIVGNLVLLDTKVQLMQDMLEFYRAGLLTNANPVFGYSMVSLGPAHREDEFIVADKIVRVLSCDLVMVPATSGAYTTKLVAGQTFNKESGMNLLKMFLFVQSHAPHLIKEHSLDKEKLEGNKETLMVAYTAAVGLKAVADLQASQDSQSAQTGNTDSNASTQGGSSQATPTSGALTQEEVVAFRASQCNDMLEKHLESATLLHDAIKMKLRLQFDGKIFTQSDVTTAIKRETDAMTLMTNAGAMQPITTQNVDIGDEECDKIMKGLDGFFQKKTIDKVPAYSSFREAYVQITGDSDLIGRKTRGGKLHLFTESLNTTSWAEVLGDSITRQMLMEYNLPGLDDWRKIVSDIVPIKDFRTNRRIRIGGYGNLPAVNQGAPYQPLTSPTDEEATYAITKRGGTEDITLEMIANDDIGGIRRIPGNLARAAANTLFEFVFDFIRTNPTIYDSVDLFHANHNNLGTTALSEAEYIVARNEIRNQTRAGSLKKLNLFARYLLVPIDLEELAMRILENKVRINADSSTQKQYTQHPKQNNPVEVITVPYWTDATDWALVADPVSAPTIEMGFFNGSEEPALFVQDQPTIGSMFTSDIITYKIRHIYGGAIMDYRTFNKRVVA
jgi:hypothetical protein